MIKYLLLCVFFVSEVSYSTTCGCDDSEGTKKEKTEKIKKKYNKLLEESHDVFNKLFQRYEKHLHSLHKDFSFTAFIKVSMYATALKSNSTYKIEEFFRNTEITKENAFDKFKAYITEKAQIKHDIAQDKQIFDGLHEKFSQLAKSAKSQKNKHKFLHAFIYAQLLQDPSFGYTIDEAFKGSFDPETIDKKFDMYIGKDHINK